MTTATSPLTKRQAQILDYLRSRRDDPPSIREIGRHFKISSPNGVICHLDALARKGHITLGDDCKARSIRLTEPRLCPHCGGEL